ncbi:ankyrin repeat domain-containing protein [Burkholderia sp. Tr-20390]|uniref:ankyrin repeat domain-containing protein n=1 Tax=Burkholderia sp. Tr-20390 TaxID=2703904 RepID=UPI001980452D|nr:ankyrin repeat domain-containing protein [Burkholderia sp. Tr-20390]MBN3729461.1 ankyrin repeat domain-containing protein [Burkholderia sp. Tr-20390]
MNAEKEFFDALGAGDVTTARDLLRRKRVGANVRQPDGPHQGRTALMAAIAHDELELAAALIEAKADLDAYTEEHSPAIHHAVSGDAIALLCHAGADINASGTEHHVTALMVAAETGKPRVLRALVQHGADLDVPDVFGRTAAHYAVLNHPELAYHLYKAGANFDLADTDGVTAREWFETTAQVRSLERTMRELEALVGPSVDAVTTAPGARNDNGYAVSYFGHVDSAEADGEFLRSLGLAVGEYDHHAGRYAVSVPGALSVDVTQFLTSFKYDFELAPVSAALICSDPSKLDSKDRRALRAYLKYELAADADDDRKADLAARLETLDAAPSPDSSSLASEAPREADIASNEP